MPGSRLGWPVSRPSFRYVLGTARLHATTAGRDLRGRLRRRPSCAPSVPRPWRPASSRPLRLTHALVACDLNPRYLDFWPLGRRAWAAIVGLEPVLVLVAEESQVPEPLRDDAAVQVFPPLPNVHTAFQAQCIRLLYPALLADAGAVVVSDVDMAPMNARYFHRPAAHVDETHFVAYRDVLLAADEIPVCYNAALPQTWGAIFGVETLDDVRERLGEWAAPAEYSGEHGGTGWGTDQQILFRKLV